MVAIISLLAVATFSILIVRFATIALTLTGLSRDSARFQAQSAFTGTGFTTKESESVVNHPVRRRIIITLMTLRSIGIVTAISSLTLSFVSTENSGETWMRFFILSIGFLILLILSRSRWIDKYLTKIIKWIIKKWGHLEVKDYYALLHLSGDYTVMEMDVDEKDWVSGKSLRELDLPDEGILVLGIRRKDGAYIGAPRGSHHIYPGDTIVIYGNRQLLLDLEKRRKGREGDKAHIEAVKKQKEILDKQEKIDKEERRKENA